MYSAFGSFYIPSCIMVFVYIKIYFAARERARRNIAKPKLSKRISRRFARATNKGGGSPSATANDINAANSPPLLSPAVSAQHANHTAASVEDGADGRQDKISTISGSSSGGGGSTGAAAGRSIDNNGSCGNRQNGKAKKTRFSVDTKISDGCRSKSQVGD